jgi:phage shock protein PspC (stress-responsive transcriptional regulator)
VNETPADTSRPPDGGSESRPRSGPTALVREPDDRKLAGVCSGLADRLGIDVTAVRLGAVVLALYTPATIVAYVVAAVVLPERRHDQPRVRARRVQLGRVPHPLLAVAAIVAVAAFVDDAWWLAPFPTAVALICVGVWLIAQSRSEPDDGRSWPPAPGPGGPSGMNDAPPGGPTDGVPGGPNDATPGGPTDATPGGPNDAVPGGPSGSTDRFPSGGPSGSTDQVPSTGLVDPTEQLPTTGLVDPTEELPTTGPVDPTKHDPTSWLVEPTGPRPTAPPTSADRTAQFPTTGLADSAPRVDTSGLVDPTAPVDAPGSRGTGPQGESTPPASPWWSGGAFDAATATVAPAAPPAAPSAPSEDRADRPRAGLVVVALLLIGGGVSWLLDAADVVDIGWTDGLALALVAVGLGLIGAAWRGRAWALVPLALLLGALLAIAETLPVPLDAGIGDRTVVVDSAAELAEDHELFAGALTLDLRQAPGRSGRPAALDAAVGAGRLQVIVPDDATVTVDAEVGAGRVTSDAGPASDESGVDVDQSFRLDGSAEGPAFDLDLEAGFGLVEVRREP